MKRRVYQYYRHIYVDSTCVIAIVQKAPVGSKQKKQVCRHVWSWGWSVKALERKFKRAHQWCDEVITKLKHHETLEIPDGRVEL